MIIKVPQNIITSEDVSLLKEWYSNKVGWHFKKCSPIQSIIQAVDHNDLVIKDDNVYYRLQSDNIIRKCKFKNINKIMEFRDNN